MYYHVLFSANDPRNDPTIGQERQRLEAHADDKHGTKCDCCEQRVAVDQRTMHGAWCDQLLKLIDLQTRSADGYVESFRLAHRRRDWTAMRYRGFGLIELAPNDDPMKLSAGRWRVTERGIAFRDGLIKVPARIYCLLGQVVDATCEEIIFEQATKLRGRNDIRDLGKKCKARLGQEMFNFFYDSDRFGTMPDAA